MLILMLVGLIFCYFVGSIPFSFLVAKWVGGIDIRQHGSGNVGATNVYRVVGKKEGIVAFSLDALKGFIAVFFVPIFFYESSTIVSFELYKIMCLAIVMCGHIWTVFLSFKGGKGMATGAGGFLALAPLVFLCSLAVWLAMFFYKRIVSLSSIVTALAAPLFMVLFREPAETVFVGALLALVIIVRHRANIGRLLKKEEKPIW